ncbi:MAG: S1 family peptidase [Chlamydiae bacterium]|nr:S1 family peptidase [Chlamydiota bacterium]
MTLLLKCPSLDISDNPFFQTISLLYKFLMRKMLVMKKFFLFFLLLLSLDAVVRRDDVADELYIEFGLEPEFMCVGLIKGEKSTGTGTLIDPYTVLTAAHVVDENPGITFHLFNPEAKEMVRVEGTPQIHEEYILIESEKGGVFQVHNDIALIHLQSPIYFVEPAKLDYRAKAPPFNFISAGYGGTRRDSLTPFFYDLKKRGYTSSIYLFHSTEYFDDFYISGFSKENPTSRLNGFSVYGDSGSGAFFAHNRKYYLFAVLSLYVHEKDYDFNYFTPIGPYKEWIEKNRWLH